jgi:succinate dehydrogenase/fumarate reductase flavoprotein subunit
MEIIKTDVLVIGGGGAGMRAALTAKERGVEVLLASKTPIGKSTCTYLSGGAFSLAAEGMSKENHLKATLQAGKGINAQDFVEILVQEAPERVQELGRFGVVGEWQKGRFFCLGKPPAWGAPLAKALADAVKRQGISILPWVMVSDLLIEDGIAAGALGFDFRNGKFLALGTKAIILANGGGGALYQRHDNPVRITGDGYALAFHAGCQLRDMEFVQFIPSGLAEPGKPSILVAPSLCDAGRVINSQGEDILQKYQITEKPVAVRSRDSFSQAIFLEETEGREVFLDLRAFSEKEWPKDNMARSQRDLLTRNFSCSQKPLRISPMCHHFMGGIVIGQNGMTEIPGLFAAGEVVGGVHGANRMGGNALSEVLVFGHRAGASALEWAKNHVWSKNTETLIHDRLRAFQRKPGSSGKGPAPKVARRMIGQILWKKSGILRDRKGLESAMGSLQRVRDEILPQINTETSKEILEKMEVENAILVGEMITRCAMMREESRGAHFRKDFPKVDDQRWRGNIFLKRSGDGMLLEFRPLPGEIS